MKSSHTRFFLQLVCVTQLASTACGPASPPAAPTGIELNTATQTLTWNLVPGATSYDVYSKALPNQQLGLVPPDAGVVTKSDTESKDATTPFSLSSFDTCNTAYFFSVSASNEDGESALTSPAGWQPPSGDCTP